MKITAPISHTDEIALLAAAGAEELYCGAVPGNWIAQFNTGAVNRRYFGNLPSLAELQKAVELAHLAGSALFLVLNAQHYGTVNQRAKLTRQPGISALNFDHPG